MFRYFYVILLLFFLSQMVSSDEFVIAPKTSTPPKIDGVLDEECWEQALPITDFYKYGTTFPAELKTTLGIVYSDSHFYLGIICYEDDMSAVTSGFAPTGSDQYTSKYSIEFFLSPPGKNITFYQMVANINNMRCDIKHNNRVDKEWQSGLIAETRKNENSWTMEIAIPAASLDIDKLRPGQIWNLCVCRNNQTYYARWPKPTALTITSLWKRNDDGKIILGGVDKFMKIYQNEKIVSIPAVPIKGNSSVDRYADILKHKILKQKESLCSEHVAKNDNIKFYLSQVIKLKNNISMLNSYYKWKNLVPDAKGEF